MMCVSVPACLFEHPHDVHSLGKIKKELVQRNKGRFVVVIATILRQLPVSGQTLS